MHNLSMMLPILFIVGAACGVSGQSSTSIVEVATSSTSAEATTAVVTDVTVIGSRRRREIDEDEESVETTAMPMPEVAAEKRRKREAENTTAATKSSESSGDNDDSTTASSMPEASTLRTRRSADEKPHEMNEKSEEDAKTTSVSGEKSIESNATMPAASTIGGLIEATAIPPQIVHPIENRRRRQADSNEGTTTRFGRSSSGGHKRPTTGGVRPASGNGVNGAKIN